MATTHDKKVSEPEACQILENETDDSRFEEFANAIVERLVGVPVLKTARTGDLGVDGRAVDAVQLDAFATAPIVLTSIRRDAKDKALEDLTRVAETQQASTVYVCSSRILSESAKEAIRRFGRQVLGASVFIHVLSQVENAELASRFPDVFLRYYGADLVAFYDRLKSVLDQPSGEVQLRICYAITSDEGFANREALSERLVIEVVADGRATVNEVRAALQGLLRMAASLPLDLIQSAMHRLVKAGKLEKDNNDRYALTPKAKEERRDNVAAAASAEESRFISFSRAVEANLGHGLDPALIRALWDALMKELAALLQHMGGRFAQLVQRVRDNGDVTALKLAAGDHVRAACAHVVRHAHNVKEKKELEDALFLALTENNSVAMIWLEKALAGWLAACQLGLIGEVGARIAPALKRIVVALDTDIVISLLCESEPDHGALRTTLAQWHSIGGRTMIAPEVIGEVAHHAAIARSEYAQISSILRRNKYDPGLARLVARNAFVRYAWSLSSVGSQNEFDRFIDVFAGADTDDVSAVSAMLAKSTFGVPYANPGGMSPQAPADLEARVRRVLARLARFRDDDPNEGAIEQDKMDRDARSIVRYAANARAVDVSSVMLLTSSRRLRVAVRQGATNSGVIASPASTLGILLSTVGSGAISPATLAQLLIAEGVREPVRAMQTELVRLLERANLLDALPPARLSLLEQQVEQSIIKYAKKSARLVTRVRRDVIQATDKDAAMEVFAQALRKVAIGAGTDALLRDALAQREPAKTIT